MERYDAGQMRLLLGPKARGTESPTVLKGKDGLPA